nr:MAG TPA: hypothetical protein [Caudoviricetes sp.]
MEDKIELFNDLLDKLRAYRELPGDDNIIYKQIIKKSLLSNPLLLYALNESSLYNELFDPNDKEHWEYDGKRKINVPTDGCRINWEWNKDLGKYEPLGEWDRYFGSDSNIRPFLFIPETQTNVKHYLCYQVNFDEIPRYSVINKYTEIRFTIFVHGNDRMDKKTGIPRHDLIASILSEQFNWSSIFGMQTKLISSKESITDNNYVVRTLVFQIYDTNGITYSPYGEDQHPYIRNNDYWQ